MYSLNLSKDKTKTYKYATVKSFLYAILQAKKTKTQVNGNLCNIN